MRNLWKLKGHPVKNKKDKSKFHTMIGYKSTELFEVKKVAWQHARFFGARSGFFDGLNTSSRAQLCDKITRLQRLE